ncbi:GNAT family N-acetyltransferase [Polaribacter sp. R77954]|uniref:GNAT family N-acetyltransferase n=1 Tax=Polaribacter sp. R77954 TaxID=3093870 RepID=UPI0037CA0596
MSLCRSKLCLRPIEPEDLEFLYPIENNESFWEVSHTQTPFSRYVLKQYLENAHLDIYETKQFRFIIEKVSDKKQIGMVDLFDFNPQHNRAGVGILIHPYYQNNGFASETLTILIDYVFSYLNLHQLYANITSDNSKSISLFKKHNFTPIGIKKDWIFAKGKYKDEILFQLIKE